LAEVSLATLHPNGTRAPGRPLVALRPDAPGGRQNSKFVWRRGPLSAPWILSTVLFKWHSSPGFARHSFASSILPFAVWQIEFRLKKSPSSITSLFATKAIPPPAGIFDPFIWIPTHRKKLHEDQKSGPDLHVDSPPPPTRHIGHLVHPTPTWSPSSRLPTFFFIPISSDPSSNGKRLLHSTHISSFSIFSDMN